MEEYKSPVYNVIAVPVEKVVANTYNPNIVAPRDEITRTFYLGGRIYDALCVLLYSGERPV